MDEKLKDALKWHGEDLLKLQGVVGHAVSTKYVKGIDTKTPCITVYVKKKVPQSEISAENVIPALLTPEVQTDVVEVGEVVAWTTLASAPLGTSAPPAPPGTRDVSSHLKRVRPVCGGISVGPTNFLMAGTIGLPLVYKGNVPCILSNTHVLAPYWYKTDPNAPPRWDEKYGIHVGANIRQPSQMDGGIEPDDYMAQLLDWAEISLDKPNQIDAAIAGLTVPAEATLLELGGYSSIADAQIGDQVTKTGRTTGVTSGQISALSVTMQVQYPHGVATMEGEVAIYGSGFSAAGDSGSAIVRKSDRAVMALLFAGSSTITLGVPIKAVFDRFGLSLSPPGTPIPEALAGIAGKYAIVWGFNNLTSQWVMYDPTDPGSTLTMLQKGGGYWIYLRENCQLTYQGFTWDLAAGWRLIGWVAES